MEIYKYRLKKELCAQMKVRIKISLFSKNDV